MSVHLARYVRDRNRLAVFADDPVGRCVTAFAPLDGVSASDDINIRFEMYTGDGSGADGMCVSLGANTLDGKVGPGGADAHFDNCVDPTDSPAGDTCTRYGEDGVATWWRCASTSGRTAAITVS